MDNKDLEIKYKEVDTPEVRQQKSRNRVFGILLGVGVILLGIIIYELIALLG